ncbi:MAG: transcription factor S [Thermoprotei archaeon]
MARFCPRCGGIMKPENRNGSVYLVCIRCGYSIKAGNEDLRAYKISTKIRHSEKEKLVVISEEDVSGLPVTREVTCPKCGYNEAYYWMIQTRAADEPPTRFYKCKRCGYTWREYE